MEFWHDLITQKSFEVLKNIRSKYSFILIGGWAVYLYTHSLKSKDIDMVVDFEELDKLKADFEIIKNDRLKKYEGKISDIDVDIYSVFYSNPGIPAEDIQKYTSSIEGFKIPKAEILLILKQKALSEREASLKGQKDKIDIISLIKTADLDYPYYLEMLKNYNLEDYKKELLSLFKKTQEATELNLNKNAFAKLKRKVFKNLEKI